MEEIHLWHPDTRSQQRKDWEKIKTLIDRINFTSTPEKTSEQMQELTQLTQNYLTTYQTKFSYNKTP